MVRGCFCLLHPGLNTLWLQCQVGSDVLCTNWEQLSNPVLLVNQMDTFAEWELNWHLWKLKFSFHRGRQSVCVWGSESGLDPQVWFVCFVIVCWMYSKDSACASVRFCAGHVCHLLGWSTASVHICHLQQKGCAWPWCEINDNIWADLSTTHPNKGLS